MRVQGRTVFNDSLMKVRAVQNAHRADRRSSLANVRLRKCLCVQNLRHLEVLLKRAYWYRTFVCADSAERCGAVRACVQARCFTADWAALEARTAFRAFVGAYEVSELEQAKHVLQARGGASAWSWRPATDAAFASVLVGLRFDLNRCSWRNRSCGGFWKQRVCDHRFVSCATTLVLSELRLLTGAARAGGVRPGDADVRFLR